MKSNWIVKTSVEIDEILCILCIMCLRYMYMSLYVYVCVCVSWFVCVCLSICHYDFLLGSWGHQWKQRKCWAFSSIPDMIPNASGPGFPCEFCRKPINLCEIRSLDKFGGWHQFDGQELYAHVWWLKPRQFLQHSGWNSWTHPTPMSVNPPIKDALDMLRLTLIAVIGHWQALKQPLFYCLHFRHFPSWIPTNFLWYTLWLLDIARENDSFKMMYDDFPHKTVIFHGYMQ